MVDPCFQLIIYSLACFAYLIVLCRLQVERILRQAAEFTSEHDTWKLGVAHAFFMQVRSETYKRGGARVCHTRVHCVDETSDIMLMCIYLYMYCIPRAPVAARLNMLMRNLFQHCVLSLAYACGCRVTNLVKRFLSTSPSFAANGSRFWT